MLSGGKTKSCRLYADGVEREINELDEEAEKMRKKACYKIQTILALQAWRRHKQNNDELKFNVKTLSEKVDMLQLQRYALKQLLDAEKVRLAIVNNDVHKILNTLEEYRQERTSMIKEREILQNRIKALEEKFAAMESEYKNQKNDLLTAKWEAQSWEKQLEKEREKLSKIKSEKNLSIEDVREVVDESKDASSANSRKVQRDARIKSIICRNTKKNSGKGRDMGSIEMSLK